MVKNTLIFTPYPPPQSSNLHCSQFQQVQLPQQVLKYWTEKDLIISQIFNDEIYLMFYVLFILWLAQIGGQVGVPPFLPLSPLYLLESIPNLAEPNRFLGSFKGLQIRALSLIYKWKNSSM